MTRQDSRTTAAIGAEAPSGTAVAVDRLVTAGLKALADYDALTQEQVDHIAKKTSVAALDHHTTLARPAVEESGRGSSRTRRPRTCSRASTSRTAWAA